MRSRTELVTTTIDNSDLSDTDLEDSEDDWKPSADNVIIICFYTFHSPKLTNFSFQSEEWEKTPTSS